MALNANKKIRRKSLSYESNSVTLFAVFLNDSFHSFLHFYL